ncbi:MAG TPA: tautomerase family protein [Povalibacter sp.]|nr:tautomerase family protein [Povalibacter sp.]
MPLVKIEVRRHRSAEQVQALIEAVHRAQREALKIPEDDRQFRYIEHRPEHFQAPPGRTENYTLIDVTLFAGRSMEARRALYRAIVRNLGELGIAPADVFIVLNEVPLENWGIRGGVPASEVDLGFKVDV